MGEPVVRVGRSYTRARRQPWMVGRIGDWRLPLGPYNVPQMVIAGGGAFVLIETFGWWSPLGPLPLVAWVAAVWLARRTRIRGRVPLAAVWGVVCFLAQPAPGRIGGRTARDARPGLLRGAFTVVDTGALPHRAAVASPVRPVAARVAARRPVAVRESGAPMSGLQRLLRDSSAASAASSPADSSSSSSSSSSSERVPAGSPTRSR